MAILTDPAHSLLYAPRDLAPATPPDVDALLNMVNASLGHPLNGQQALAFRSSFQERLTLLWGPPGTGKTATLAGIILGWLENAWQTGCPISICVGSSNWNAIDNVLRSVAALLRKRWETGPGTMPTHIKRVTGQQGEPLDDDAIEPIRRRTAEADVLKRDLDAQTCCLVVGSTWLQLRKLHADKPAASAVMDEEEDGADALEEEEAAESSQPDTGWFDLIVLDEASQVKVAEAAGYFLLARPDANVILAGDDQQLGPVYSLQMQDTEKGLLDCVYSYVREAHTWEPVSLVQNYRTNQEISVWPRDRFYPQGYEAFHSTKRLDLTLPASNNALPGWPDALTWSPHYLQLLDPAFPVVVVVYPPCPYTVVNPFEAQVAAGIACLYRLILQTHGEDDAGLFWTERLGIVTPHRAQMSRIRDLLVTAAGFPADPPPIVDTVDRFQGQERDVIISSYTVGDKDFVGQEEDFILSRRRFNVTLTRARCKFIMLVSRVLIDYLPSDMQTAIDASHLQLFVEEYCGHAGDISLPFQDGTSLSEVACSLRSNGHHR